MPSPAHTPGPWTIRAPDEIVGDGHLIAISNPHDSITVGEERANTALIAPAPDLLAASEALIATLDDAADRGLTPQEQEGWRVAAHHPASTALRAAIARARRGA